MSKTICITGGAGFIGSHLTEALAAEGCRVVVLDNLSTGHRSNLESLAGSIELASSANGPPSFRMAAASRFKALAQRGAFS